jgi:hypothetical protein
VSRLCLGGLIKHVSHVERRWIDFVLHGTEAMTGLDEESLAQHAATFEMLPGETLAGLLDQYEQVAAPEAWGSPVAVERSGVAGGEAGYGG